MRFGSASALERIELCPPSAVLPSAEGDGFDGPDPFSGLGTAKHEYLADVLELGAEKALARVADPDVRARCARLPVADLPSVQRGSWAAEVALAYSWHTYTARELGRRIGRRYKVCDSEIPGTLDLVGLADDDTVVVVDFKTGFHRVTPAHENWQMRFLALAAARAWGRSRAVAELWHVPEDEPPFVDRAEFEAADLMIIAADVEELALRVDAERRLVEAGGEPSRLNDGHHCRRCPVLRRGACPMYTDALVQLARGPEEAVQEIRSALTPGSAAHAYKMRRRIGFLLEHVDKALYAYGTVNPFEVEPGVWFGPVVEQTDKVDSAIARKVIEQRHGTDVADQAAERKFTKKALEGALRPIAPPRGLAKMQRETLEAISAAGGITVVERATTKEHRRP